MSNAVQARRPMPVAARRPAAAAPKRQKKVPAKSLAVFTRQLSVMIDAGLPLVQCLELLAKEEPHKGLSSAVQKVQTDVEAGASLAESMSRQPQAFNLLFTHMVAAGESAVAGEVGFPDAFHFSRVFRSVLGLSPAAFRGLR
jgi:type IV pilus assembly protein PilC